MAAMISRGKNACCVLPRQNFALHNITLCALQKGKEHCARAHEGWQAQSTI